jgi:hypothetical protein
MFVKKRILLHFLSIALAGVGTALGGNAMAAAPFQFASPGATPENTPVKPIGGDLRKMAASQFDLFFGGEFASHTVPFFALPEEASSPSALVLTMQTAISVAPEDSKMIIKVNGTQVGTTGLMAGDPRRIQLAVPAGVIHPGYNAVTISAEQRHRVDCAIDATYELWTKIDPDKSGFIYDGMTRPAQSLVDLLPLSGAKNGRTSMRVVLPAGSSMAEYDRAMNVVQALTILGNFNHPAIEFGSAPGTGPGIDIYLGTKSALARILGNEDKALTSNERFVVEAGDANRKRLVISGLDAQDLDNRSLELASMALTDRPAGSPEGLTALANLKGRTLIPGEKVSLGQLGYAGKRFSGRYEVSQINFTMPSDFYPGDYASINLHLSALYVGGLAPNAVLTIRANDKVVANIPLSSPREGEIRDQRLPIPFSVLRPGQNTLMIEARLPSRQDSVCESVENASSSVRLAVNQDSYLEVPDYARVGRYPDIAVLTSGLTTRNDDIAKQPTLLFVPNYEPAGLNAAATFVAKMAYTSGHIQKVAFTSTIPDGDDNSLIAFGSYDTLPSELTTRMKLDFINIKAAAVKASPLEIASLDTEQMPALDPALSIDKTETSSTSGQFLALADRAKSFFDAPLTQSGHILQWGKSIASGEMAKLNFKYLPALLDDQRADVYSPSSNATLVIAQQSSNSGGVWTVIASRASDGIDAETDVLTDDSVWKRLGGAVQSFSDAGQVIDQKFSSKEYLFLTQPLTIANGRLIAAGWLANNAEIYVSALLAAAVLLGLGTFLVLITGRRSNG